MSINSSNLAEPCAPRDLQLHQPRLATDLAQLEQCVQHHTASDLGLGQRLGGHLHLGAAEDKGHELTVAPPLINLALASVHFFEPVLPKRFASHLPATLFRVRSLEHLLSAPLCRRRSG
jgi:hypothetical protein